MDNVIPYNFSDLAGKTFTKIIKTKNTKFNQDELYFFATDGNVYNMFHDQECCENVQLEDICGSLSNLIGCQNVMAEKSSNEGTQLDIMNHNGNEHNECFWTFYKFATSKGYVTIRWYGDSNGYYSVEAEICKIPIKEFEEWWDKCDKEDLIIEVFENPFSVLLN